MALERLWVSTRLIVGGHVLNPLWWSAERRRARRSDVFGRVVTDYLRRHYLSAADHLKDTEICQTEPERIFTIWFQGEENAPLLVKNCFASIRKHCTQELVVLDEKSVFDWITLPQVIVDKFRAGKMKYAHFSDICRVELLHEHGGYWLDATAFVTHPIPEFIEDCDFFVYRSGKRISGYYSYVQNCFIHARKGAFLLEAWREMILKFWEEEDKRVDYFQHQLMLKVLAQGNGTAMKLFSAMPQVDHDGIHSLWYLHGDEQADETKLGELVSPEFFFQKTSYREAPKAKPGTWRDYILKQTEG